MAAMANKAPHKKSGYEIQFLLPNQEHNSDAPGLISEFLEKLSPDQIVRDNDPDSVREGYVVIFESHHMERQVNPGEFLQLSLPEADPGKRCWEFSFAGKKGACKGGLIVPSDLMSYLLLVHSSEGFPAVGIIRNIVEKLGFGLEKRVINQEPPFPEINRKVSLLKEKIMLNLAWNTSLPLKEARIPALKNLFFTQEHPLFRLAFFATAIAIFLIIPILSLDAGLSGDDEKHYEHAAKVFRYFAEDDPAALTDPKHKLNFYGQSFDFFTYLAIRFFGLEDHPYEARHVLVAISGAAAILFTGLLVRLFSGYSGGLLAIILMFLSPRFLGHAFNNPMDIPFALGNIFTLYHLVLFLKKLPRISARSAIWIAVGIGFSNGIRIGGILLIPYVFLFAGLYLLVHKWPWKFFSAQWWRFTLRGMGTLLLISAAGYLLSLLTWPYALQDIINHPVQAFKVMTDIQVSIRVLYDGTIHWSDKLPWHYIPKNILFTVPVLILLGWATSVLTWFTGRKEGNGFWYFMLWFTILFPVLFIIYRESNVYGGWRHMMFIYPSIAALSAMALTSLIRKVPENGIRYAAIGLVAAALFHPVRHVIRNHPNTYIYFNELSGGINHTVGRFETDYYTNSLKPASDHFIEKILPEWESKKDGPVRVVSNFSIRYYFREHRDRVQTLYSRYYDRGKKEWDYAILYCNYIHPSQMKNGMWPPKNTIHEIKVDSVVVAAIVERKNSDDYHGSVKLIEAMQEQSREKLNQALLLLQSAVEYDPTNEIARLELGNAYSAFLRFDDARTTMDDLLEIYPDYDKALNAKGYTYLMEAEYTSNPALIDEAIRIISLAINSNYKFYSGYYNLGICYGLKDDLANAEYNLRLSIKFNSKFKAAYNKLAELYEITGEDDKARQIRARASNLPG
ncbi:MAG: tetratricopeptide repeat protein [Bacteroidetes bacterium]|nr:tetratricopeptide repeat protein [Bacteroidota bacterium]